MNREQWLTAAYQRIRESGLIGGLPPKIAISVGWAYGKRKAVVGQTWSGEATQDGIPAIFISPYLASKSEVLETLVHEMVHAAGNKGHGVEFKSAALKAGLVPQMGRSFKGTRFASESMRDVYMEMMHEEYPHAQVNPSDMPYTKQPTRLIKARCPHCGYTVRVTVLWLAKGAPLCPDGVQMQTGILSVATPAPVQVKTVNVEPTVEINVPKMKPIEQVNPEALLSDILERGIVGTGLPKDWEGTDQIV